MAAPAVYGQQPVFVSGSSDHFEKTARFYLFCAGSAAGLLQLFSSVDFGAGFEMVAIGKNLAEHGSFANPYAVAATGATAAVPPAYPFVLGALYAIFHSSAVVSLIATIGSIIVNAVIASWFPKLSMVFFDTVLPGVIGGFLWLNVAQLMPSWDTSYTVAGLIAFCIASGRFSQKQQNVLSSAALVAPLAAALSLMNPSSVLVVIPWIAYLLWACRAQMRRMLLYASIVVCAVIVADGAWMWRNYRQLGAFVLRTNLGMTLYASNNDCAEASLVGNEQTGCYQAHHPNTSEAEAQLLSKMGEPVYDRQRIQDVKKWAAEHPLRFLKLTGKRIWQFWFPVVQTYQAVWIWIVTLLSIPGFMLLIRDRIPIRFFAAAAFVLYPLLYYVVVSAVRYRYPVLWISCIIAGYACAKVRWVAAAWERLAASPIPITKTTG